MNKVEITASLISELGKLLLRSDEKPGTLREGAQKFLSTHSYAFTDTEILTQRLQTDAYSDLFKYLFGEEEEPCHLPFTPGFTEIQDKTNGFLVHIFKGEQDIVPINHDKIKITHKQYYRLLHTLRHDLKRLESPPSLETWVHLLQRYTKWIPANNHFPFISLYDYARLKMALTACISESELESWRKQQEANTADTPKFMALYVMKIIGKNEFVYNLKPEMNLDLLKGGLYYTQMLREFFSKECLKTLDLPICNCLFEGESHFVLLVSRQDVAKLDLLKTKLEEFLLKHYQGKLALACSSLPLAFEDLQKGQFARVWELLWSNLSRENNRPFVSLLQKTPDYHSQIFGPLEQEPNQAKVGGDNASLSETTSPFLKSLEELSNHLVKSRWIAVTPDNSPQQLTVAQDWQELPHYFNIHTNFLPRKPEPEPGMQIYRFGNTDFACPSGTGFMFSEALSYLTGELSPEHEKIDYWTIIKLKIIENQNLEKHTLWSYLTTYEHLQDFFKTYLSSLLREKKYRRHTYMVYTTDHQLTIACSPQIALALVYQIYQKFREFNNDEFHLGGRISVFSAEYPIQQALYQEQKELDMHERWHNKITIMGENIACASLEILLRTQERLAMLAKLKGKRCLLPLLGITDLYRLRAKDTKEKKNTIIWRNMIYYYLNHLGITDNLETDRGPAHLALAIRWNYFMSQE